ncbi:MAG: hypothetical protein HC880_15020 [Bacteroidia bacterium]|nr:hypothetical protein [Bacteroidia bacterium]
MRLIFYPFILGLAMPLSSCSEISLKSTFQARSPYEQYVRSLQKAALEGSALFQNWQEAGQRVLSDSSQVTLPYREQGYFAADQPKASGLRFEAGGESRSA